MSEEKKHNAKTSKNLKNLYLDPNNYRFIDNPKYVKIDNSNLLNDTVQARTKTFIEGKNRKNVEDLLDSFKTNGYMDIDIIQVKEISENKFLVLEGNRRVTALKILQEEHKNSQDIGNFDPAIFGKIPFEIHDVEDEGKHQVIMGLKHITRNKTWPALNQAQLIYDIMSKYSDQIEGENFIKNSLGISVSTIRKYVRTLKLIEHYKKSDFRDCFTTDMYSIFEEIIKKPNIKAWLGFDDRTYQISNTYNLSRLFSWLSPSDGIEYREEIVEEEIISQNDPIITKAFEIRDLAEFIDDEKALKKMEDTGKVSQGLIISEYVGRNKFQEALTSAHKDIKNAIHLEEFISDKDILEIEKIKIDLEKLLPKKTVVEFKADKNNDAYFTIGNIKHFEEIEIKKYRIFENFKINGFKKVNIFVGLNNSGKTTLLEAIYLLSIQNDMKSFFEFIKLKNKFNALDISWLKAHIQKGEIKGTFNSVNVGVNINNGPTEEDIDKIDYETTIEIESRVDDEKRISVMHLFGSKDPQLHFKNIKYLCSTMFKSPYFYSHNDLLNSHAISVEKKVLEDILVFIRKIDNSIEKIELIEHYGVKRFSVTSSKFDKAKDLTSYGEGLQRIFEIALSFAYCKNGILLIDEIETAIHKSLLIDFTEFIQKFAEKFNVQVFITSHSKECIDAFVKNDYKNNNDLMAYLLKNNNESFSYKYIDGKRLKILVDDINLDIRG
ncbi:AAA family ATPase [Aliarcobacter cryaerophilus]|uniref:AAA family ATPase n=1 Tax=Arcobacter sp. AZ-2023 TaxID=3074453 RepID=A0AA96DLQ5_9BACT|nr:AAA family ATPase [Arcobacter sp. AZ-2023]